MHRSCQGYSRQTGPSQRPQCRPGSSTPRSGRRSPERPRWCISADRAIHATPKVHDKQVRARDRNAQRSAQPRDQGGVHRSPAVVYAPIVPLLLFVTNRSEPEIAMPSGLNNPEIRAGFTVVPVVVYWPIVPSPLFTTNRFEPETAMPRGLLNPEIRAAFTVAPAVVYLPIVPPIAFATNRSEPETAIPTGKFIPEIRAGFTVAPVL